MKSLSNLSLKIFTGYLLYLGAIPRIIQLQFPCTRPIKVGSFASDQCNTVAMLDVFISWALGGLVIILLWFIWQLGPIRKQKLIFSVHAVVIVVMAIASYYLYLPLIESQVAQAPIIIGG